MQRILTVSYKTETRGGSKPYSPTTYIEVPALCLKGKWLDELGFEIGTKVIVECQNGQLIIRKNHATRISQIEYLYLQFVININKILINIFKMNISLLRLKIMLYFSRGK